MHGTDRPVLAGATAAAWSRLPAVAFTVGDPDARVWTLLKGLGCEVHPRPTAEEASRDAQGVRASQGFQVLPGLEDPDYLAGIATVGVELARDLPTDTELVVVSPADVGRAVALGLAAAGVSVRVEAVDEYGCPASDELLESVRTGLRLDVGPASLAALQQALEHGAGPRCAVLGC